MNIYSRSPPSSNRIVHGDNLLKVEHIDCLGLQFLPPTVYAECPVVHINYMNLKRLDNICFNLILVGFSRAQLKLDQCLGVSHYHPRHFISSFSSFSSSISSSPFSKTCSTSPLKALNVSSRSFSSSSLFFRNIS